MKAVVVRQYGGPEVLELVEVDIPEPGPDEALIRLEAIGLNFKEVRERSGTSMFPAELPYTPGVEGAGVVEAVGSDVSLVQPGDRVCYVVMTRDSYAQYVTVAADRLVPLPDDVPAAIGAAGLVQGMTAQYLLHEFVPVTSGTNVVIHAAAGGMGLILTQWAKHLGARVIGTVSTEAKAAAARAAGADDIINYSHENFSEVVGRLTNRRGVDLVIDGVGKSTFAGSLESVARRGHVVLYGSASGHAEPFSPNSLQRGSRTLSGADLFDFIESREELLQRAAAAFAGYQQGWLQFRIDQKFALSEIAEAHRRLGDRGTIGKLVVIPPP